MVINRQNKNSKNQRSKIKMIRLHSQIRKAFQGRSRGLTLIEVVIAIAFIGVIAIAFLSALSTASTVLIVADERATAESLARSQMEYVKNQADLPDPGELPIPSVYKEAGYNATLEADPLRTDLLYKITIRVDRNGEELVTLVGYKLFL
jgi:type II secretory pathway pseudopilin PulG